MRPKALLAFTSLTFLFGAALAAPKRSPDFSNPPSKDNDSPETSSNEPNTGGGPSGGTGQKTCPSQTYDPSGLICNVDSGSSIRPLTFCLSSFQHRDLCPSLAQAKRSANEARQTARTLVSRPVFVRAGFLPLKLGSRLNISIIARRVRVEISARFFSRSPC